MAYYMLVKGRTVVCKIYTDGQVLTDLGVGNVDHSYLIEREGDDVFVVFDVRFILQGLSQTLQQQSHDSHVTRIT